MSYVDELLRGYGPSEPRTRADKLDLSPWTTKPNVELYAQRNGELHVLCHEMLNALEYLGCEPDIIHGFRKRLHNVPQCRGV